MSELSDWKRHIHEPEVASLRATINALRAELAARTEPSPSRQEVNGGLLDAAKEMDRFALVVTAAVNRDDPANLGGVAAAIRALRAAIAAAEAQPQPSDAAALKVSELEGALRPFAEACRLAEIGGYPPASFVGAEDFHAARATLARLEEDQGSADHDR